LQVVWPASAEDVGMHLPNILACSLPVFPALVDCRTLALIKPDAVQHMGKIINAITTSGFSIT
jgi:hypothetical protein